MRKTHSNALKFKVAMETMLGNKTVAEISSEYDVAPSLIHKWKKQLKERGANVFAAQNTIKKHKDLEKVKLYEQIGRLKVENEFLKKIVED